MAVVIALFNQAGGVGKTTLTQNLGYHLGQREHQVLLIDLDPQGSLTIFTGIDPDKIGKTPYDALVNEEPLFVLPNIHGVDLAPTNINLSATEIQLVNLDFREVRLKEAIAPISDSYDFILIDCPPSLGLLSYNSLIAASHVLIPVETHHKAFAGTDLLFKTIAKVRKRGNRALAIAGFIPSRYATANSQDRRILEGIREQFASVAPVFDPVPRATAFADAAEQGVPLAVYDPRHAAVKVLDRIAAQLEKLREP